MKCIHLNVSMVCGNLNAKMILATRLKRAQARHGYPHILDTSHFFSPAQHASTLYTSAPFVLYNVFFLLKGELAKRR